MTMFIAHIAHKFHMDQVSTSMGYTAEHAIEENTLGESYTMKPESYVVLTQELKEHEPQ